MLKVDFKWRRSSRLSAKTVASARPKSAAAKSRYKKQTTDPDAYNKYKREDAARKRLSYKRENAAIKGHSNLIAQRRARWAEAKKNQRKERKYRGNNNLPPDCTSKRLKDLTTEEKREYMRLKKQESRKRMSKQKRTFVKKKETEARAVARRQDREKDNEPSTPKTGRKKSRTTIFRKTKQAKEKMPKSPGQYASVVERLLESASPKKRREIEKRGLKRNLEESFVGVSLRKTIKELRTGMTERKRKHYHAIAWACQRVGSRYRKRVASSLGIGKTMRKKQATGLECRRRRRRDATSEDLVYLVEDFWKSEGISRVVPMKRKVKKGQPCYVLEVNYTQAYQKFQATHPDVKLGYTKFIQFKPRCVKHLNALERVVCCCKQCENTKLKLKAINSKASEHGLRLSTIDDLSRKTLCLFEGGFPKRACTDRICQDCGPMKLDEWYLPLVQAEEDTDISYNEWRMVEEEKVVKKRGQINPQKIKRKVIRLVTEKCKVQNLVTKLKTSVEKLSSHLFRAEWQQTQFRLSKENMPPRSAVTVIDFAENYSCQIQDEVQSYHWAQEQVTLHPVMAFVNATDDVSPQPTHTEAIYCVSDDPKHDANAVETFMKISTFHLQEKFGVRNEVRFSDCCAAQYRGRTSFADISLTETDHNGLKLSRHYFESCHGKSAADGLAAIVKNAASSAVARRQTTIRNAKEFYNFCTEEMQQVGNSIFQSRADTYKDAGRSFFFVSSADINRNRPDRAVHPVKGTMQIHAIEPVGPYNIQTRDLSCFCTFCRYGQGLECSNKLLVSAWNAVTLHAVNPVVGETNYTIPETVAVEEALEYITDQEASTDDEDVEGELTNSFLGDGADDTGYSVGDFVGVKILHNKHSCYIYMAEVIEIDFEQDEALVKYLVKCGGNLYRWPDSLPEYSTEPNENLLGPFQPPTVVNARGQMRFQPEQMSDILATSKMQHKSVCFK